MIGNMKTPINCTFHVIFLSSFKGVLINFVSVLDGGLGAQDSPNVCLNHLLLMSSKQVVGFNAPIVLFCPVLSCKFFQKDHR